MDNSPSTLDYRRFNLEHDLAALVNLLQEVEQVDQAGEVISEAGLREQLTWSGQDPALTTWVVALPDSATLVGYGRIQKTPYDENADVYIAVHHSWRRQGIAGQLFVRLLECATELLARTLRVYTNVRNEEAHRFVRALGFSPVASYTHLRVSARHPFPWSELPAGFSVRSYAELQRIDLYTDAMNRCYEGLWGHLRVTHDEVARWLPRLNQSGIFLLFAPDDTLAGTCRADLIEHPSTEQRSPTGLIDAPGIIPAYRDAQLALPLLLTAIHWLLPQSPETLELESWGDAPDTLALYRALGFGILKEECSYRRDLA